MVLKTKVNIDGITVKDDSAGLDPKLIFRWEFERTNESGIAELVIDAPRKIMNTVELSIGKAISVWKGFTTSTDEKIFEGFISEFETSGGVIKIECKDKMWDLIRRNVNKIYDANADPQAGVISEIARDLIETFAGLNAEVVATGTEEGRTIEKFRCIHTDIYERIMALAKAVDYQVWYDAQNDVVKFEPRGYNASGITLAVGQEIIGVPEWDYDTSQMINDLRVDGAVSETQLRLPLSGAGQIATTEGFETDRIILPKTPETVELLLDGTNPPTTIRQGGSQDGTTGNYYFVDRENKEVKPIESTTFPSGNFAIVRYTWLAPSPIHMANQDSKDNFGIFEKQITLSDIITVADAEARASEILNRFSTPFLVGSILIRSSQVLNVKVGDTVVIVDGISSPNINGEFVITKQTLKYPGENQKLIIGDKELRLADWQMNVEERLKRLEEQFLKNQDLILELFNFQNQFTSSPRYRKVQISNIGGDTLIWGSPSFGIWGQFKWGNQATFGFVLGHATAGVLGTSKLGSNTSTPVDHFVQQYQNIYTEEFIDTDFKDVEETSASWTTVGNLTFSSENINQTNSNGYDDLQDTDWRAQTFTVGSNKISLDRVTLKLFRNGTIGNVIVSIRATSGGVPTGSDIVSGSFNGDTLTMDDNGEEKIIVFNDFAILEASTIYAIILRAPDQAVNQLSWRIDTTNPYSGGSAYLSSNSGGAWSPISGMDFWFKIPGRQVAQSSGVDFNNSLITQAKLTATEVSGTFDYEISANGGANWEAMTNGVLHNFANSGMDLQFRIKENAGSTGQISKVVITNYH